MESQPARQSGACVPVSTKDVAEVCRVAPPDRTILLTGAFQACPMVLADALILATGAPGRRIPTA